MVVNINLNGSVDTDQIYIAPFLFQPIIENIFKHAFNDSIINPQIDLSIFKNGAYISYSIEDNGVGLNKKSFTDLMSKSKSKGLKITQSQLNKYFPGKLEFDLVDKEGAGSSWRIVIYN